MIAEIVSFIQQAHLPFADFRLIAAGSLKQ
jgi:hypothetical protein